MMDNADAIGDDLGSPLASAVLRGTVFLLRFDMVMFWASVSGTLGAQMSWGRQAFAAGCALDVWFDATTVYSLRLPDSSTGKIDGVKDKCATHPLQMIQNDATYMSRIICVCGVSVSDIFRESPAMNERAIKKQVTCHIYQEVTRSQRLYPCSGCPSDV